LKGNVKVKFLHTSDLHIGKKLFELPMLEEQKHYLARVHEEMLRTGGIRK